MILPYLKEFSEVIASTMVTSGRQSEIQSESAIAEIADMFMEMDRNGGKVYLVGNGGSSGIISHSSIDFINACKMKAMPLTDNSILTCLANDYGYENVFSKALETMFTEKDILIAVSSSGSSKNILNAAEAAKKMGGRVLTYSGFKSDNPLRSKGDYNIWLNSNDYGKVEIGHALLLHVLTDELMRRKMDS